MITITFPDGSSREYKEGTTPLEVAKSLSEGLARITIAAKIGDEFVDATIPMTSDSNLRIITINDPESLDIIRHSAAHLLAHAVKRLYPKAKPTIGPVIDNGFYYDFDNLSLKEGDLKRVEEEMKKIVSEDIPVERIEHKNKDEALKIYADNEYKVEMINDLEKVSSYKQGDFIDLCRGPHVYRTGILKKVGLRLDKISGAYWRGNSDNKMLTRIYGLCFPTRKELNDFLKNREEAEKRDHRRLGKALDLFSIHEEAPGMPFFHDNGFFIYSQLMDFMTEAMKRRGYQIVRTPIIMNKNLWLQSGHWDHYKENMYFSKIDDQDVAVKPMNCPGHILIYKNRIHSYRELPIRMGEFGLVHRHELSGVLSGLFRVRCFVQDDAHIFCSEDQIKIEIGNLLDLINEVYSTFGFSYSVELSTKPEKAMGDPKIWDLAEKSLSDALKGAGIDFKINEGDGAFYGPKIDFHVKDAIGRSWQCGTIQLDFSMPEKFGLTYEGKDGARHRPVMIHRAIYGSFERFIGILIEHYSGKFPLWLSPRQIKILTISEKHKDYAVDVLSKFHNAGFRASLDSRTETINKKVREAQLEQWNYILVVGDKESINGTVTVRTRDNKVHGAKPVDDFLKELVAERDERR